MANVSDGNYRLVNAATVSKTLNVIAGTNFRNGTRLDLYAPNNTDAQVFQVSTRSDGTRQIVNRISGKSIDIQSGVIAAGTPLQLWDDNDTNAQRWNLVEAGTVTIDGSTVPTFFINSAANSSYRVVSNGGIVVGSGSSASAQWAFVKVSALTDGGVYEIRSMLSPSKLAVDISAAAKTNGANVQLYAVNHTNAQKFVVKAETQGYSIRSVNSGKYVDVSAAIAADGTNVQQWDDNDTRAQRWNFVGYGTTTVDGKTCGVYSLCSYVESTGVVYAMDVKAAIASSSTNIQIWTKNNTDAQKFALFPCEANDPTMPVPHDLGAVEAAGDEPAATIEESDDAFLASWNCSDAWCADGANHYEIRSRSRLMATNSTWNDWGAWTDWRSAIVAKDGTRSTDLVGFVRSYDWDDAKNKETEVQVRAAGADGLALLHGAAADKVISIPKRPDNDITSAGWSPAGLVLGWTTDYTLGTAYVNVKGVSFAGNDASATAVLSGTSSANEGVIAAENFKEWPSDGSQVKVVHSPGYDQHADFGDPQTDTLTVSYDAGSVSVEPTLTTDGYKMTATVPALGSERMWVKWGDRLVECEKVGEAGGLASFDVLYPMGNDFQLFTLCEGPSSWGCDETDVDAVAKVCHAWNFAGGSAFLGKFNGKASYTVSKTAVYESNILDGREHESVSYQGTVKAALTVSGILLDGDQSTTGDFDALLAAGHARYRSTDGDLLTVAVTGVTQVRRNGYAEITVTMIEETL